MAKKTKPTLADRAAFDALINQIAEADTELRQLTAEMDEQLQTVRDRYADRIEAKTEWRKNAHALCKAYASEHQDEVLKPGTRSGETALATYGYHLTPPSLVMLNRKHTWASVIAAIRERGTRWVNKYLTTPDPRPNKEVLKATLNAAELAALGLRLEQKDEFIINAKDKTTPEN